MRNQHPDLRFIVPLKYGFGCIIIRSPYTPYSIYLRGTIGFKAFPRAPADRGAANGTMGSHVAPTLWATGFIGATVRVQGLGRNLRYS